MKLRPGVSIALAATLAVAGCSLGATTHPSQAVPTASATAGVTSELTIFAAASLKGALDKAKIAYEAGHAGTTLVISTDSSAALETQIEQGAPTDVFLSADTANPGKLVDGGFAVGDAVVFAGNKLTLIVPAGNPGGVESPADLAKKGLRIIAAGDEVPITKYATEVVSKLAALPSYPSGFAAAYAANIVTKVENVKAIVAQIELGQGDGAIVYVTDAKASTKVKTVTVPEAANAPATYAGVAVKASTHHAAAAAFLAWLAGPQGQAVLETFGFLPPAP